VVFFIENDNITLADQRADGPKVHLHAGGEHQGGFLAHPFRQFPLQIFNQGHVAVQKTRPGAAGAIFRDGVHRRLAHFGVRGQTQVVVGTAHDNPAAFVQYFRAFVFIQGNKIWISAFFPGFAYDLKVHTLRKDIHFTRFQIR